MTPLRIVTWNVNSLRARLPRVQELLEQHQPDVVLMQETKVSPEQFPHEELASLGYHAVDASSGQWTGVAIAVRKELALEDPKTDLFGSPVASEARWVEATVEGIRFASVYVINGRSLDHEMYFMKLEFLQAMADRAADLRAAGTPMVIAGDTNVCPRDVDVYDPDAFAGATHVSVPERLALQRVLDQGDLVDAHVQRYGEHAQQFTWWDYRAGHFHKGYGLRIDQHMVSRSLADGIADVRILRDLRKGTKPSDHAPLELELGR
ncbi:MAG: exodeoxyribonuclease III [Solirubrobacteraceae bacterium]|nr:exodeoxyribonuclease III [Solirubrobacteraceae bacterium]